MRYGIHARQQGVIPLRDLLLRQTATLRLALIRHRRRVHHAPTSANHSAPTALYRLLRGLVDAFTHARGRLRQTRTHRPKLTWLASVKSARLTAKFGLHMT
jgi:hypothetical protein